MDADDHMIENQAHHLGPKPLCRSTSNRNGHETESKAWAISSLKRNEGLRSWWSTQADYRTRKKLSWIERVVMKADWLGAMIVAIIGATRTASILEKIFAKLWIKLIGR